MSVATTTTAGRISYLVTNLSPGTTYGFTVAAYDAAGNVSAQSNSVSIITPSVATTTAATADTTAPSTPTGLYTTPLDSSGVTLYWNPSTDNVGVVGYKVYQNGVFLINATSPSINLGSGYAYTVAAYDAAGNVSAQSGSVSATTVSSTTTATSTTAASSTTTSPPPPPPTPAFTISNVRASSIEYWAYFEWTTSIPTNKRNVWVGESPGNYTSLVDSGGCSSPEQAPNAYLTNQCVALSFRKANTTYYYKVSSKDSSGNEVSSAEYSFTTGAIPVYSTAPAVSNIQATNITGSSVTITWTTDQLSTTAVNYGLTGQLNQDVSDGWLTTAHSKTITGLSPGTAYGFKVYSWNTSNKIGLSSVQSFTTSGSSSNSNLAFKNVAAILTALLDILEKLKGLSR